MIRREDLQKYANLESNFRILQKNYKGPNMQMEAFEEQKLSDWKGITEHTK